MSEGPIVYSFTTQYPVGGYCESKHGPGPLGVIKEPGNVCFCLLSTLFGVLGLYKSRQNMSTSIMYLYALICGYGITRALQHALILNGLDKISETTILKILEMLIVAGFTVCIRDKWSLNLLPGWLFGAALCVIGIYPPVAMVWSSSDANPWVGWLTFDLVWFLILLQVIIIWFSRKSYPVTNMAIFNVIWYTVVAIIIAYIFWLVDEFSCNYVVARLYLRGLWYILLAWGFYNCIVLIAYLVADSFNKQPVATFWPSEKFIVLVTVQWQDKECAKTD